jgi:ABC-type transporter Mla subunit MlaD
MSTIDERLDRLVSTTEFHTGMIANLATLTEDNTRQIADLRLSISSLVNVAEQHQQSLEVHQYSFEQHQRNFEQHQQSIDAAIAEIQRMGDEIRGLQTENRRILDQLINRNGNGASG